MEYRLLEETAPYDEVTAALKSSEDEVLQVCMASMQSNPGFTHADIYGWGIGRRAIALSNAYRTLAEQANSIGALPMVRMQLDTALRLYAGFFAPDPMAFSKAVLEGEQIDRLKSDEGERMRDKYLLNRVAIRNPWMHEVYKITSGYIHFSGKHLIEVFKKTGEGGFQVVIGPNDIDRTTENFHQPSRCLHHLNLIIHCALEDWFAKARSPKLTQGTQGSAKSPS